MNRRKLITLLGGAAAWPLAARAQRQAGPRLIGALMLYNQDSSEVQRLLAAFHEALGKLGWTQGQNVKFEYRWVGADPALMQQGAKELVALQPDLIVTSSSPTTAVLLQQTRTIPIVFFNIVDPVGQGFAVSLSRPGGNATGLVNLEPSMAGKWIELLKQVMPRMARVVVPFHVASTPYADLYLNHFKSTAPSFDVEVVAAPVHDMAGLEAVASAQAREPNSGIILMPSAFMSGRVRETATLMTKHRLPAIYAIRSFAVAGGLVTYGNEVADNYRRAAGFVDRILKGEKPSELPIEFPVKFELVVNLKTAQTFGLEVPPTLLATADEVIE
jgi:ABC-type uncharacterized transport system substrate-binding protein